MRLTFVRFSKIPPMSPHNGDDAYSFLYLHPEMSDDMAIFSPTI
jgi:hypothetical protein